LCNIKGEIIFSVKKNRPLESGGELVRSMISLVEELIKKSKVDTSNVHGVGIGIPGIFNRETGSVRWPLALLKDDMAITVSIHDMFEEKLGISTFVDNDANAAVFGEEWFGEGLGVQHAIYLYSGYGCGLMINGQVYRGINGCAGEWLFEIPPGSVQPLVESYKAGYWSMDIGIALEAQTHSKEHTDSKIYELVKGDLKKITIVQVAQAAEMGDAYARALLEEAGRRLGHKAAFLVNLLNPELLIVGGGIEIGGTVLMDALKDTVKRLAIPEAADKIRITPSRLGENGVPLGAAALVAQSYFISV